MCGIAGAVSLLGHVDGEAVRRMVSQQRHRGPDHEDVWTSPAGRCVLGYDRLSIIDLSAAGNQPMHDPATGNTIVYNGEIYNFRELREQCRRDGYHFRSNSDTEVILALYGKHGHACVAKLRGMFAFAIWDERRQQLFMARDRSGEKPLNYALSDGQLLFASEIAPLAAHPDVSGEIDVEALELYLELQHVPAPWSIYRSVRKLPPGHLAVFDRSGLRMERYWQLDYRTKQAMTDADALDALEEHVRDAVRVRLVADVPVGATLSGGVDSSLVVAMMAGLMDQPVKTFTVSFADEAFDESPFAREIADRYGTDHHVVTVESDVQELLPQMLRHYGEPYGDKAAVPAFHVSRMAGEHVKVALNGDGGDELLGGYQRYAIPSWRLAAGVLVDRWRDPRSALGRLGGMQAASSLWARGKRRLTARYLHPELQSIASWLYWGDRARERLLGGLGSDVVQRWRSDWLAGAMEHADHPVDRMLWIDNHTYLPDDGLVKMDIAAMHCSLEPRTPLVDHELVEFCSRLPVAMKVRHQTGKYLLKRLAERYMPEHLVYRPKQGFSIPVDSWLRGPLLPYVRDHLLDGDLVAPLDPQTVSRTLDEFIQGRNHHAYRIWLLLIFTVWREISREGAPVLPRW